MPRLLLFGGATLSSGDVPHAGRGAQRRRLALLALLATESRPLTREKLVGWLWPESEPDKARRLLSESLYVLRRELGEGALPSSGEEVWLDATVVGSDVADFRAAIAARRWADAVELHVAPFLDGFYIPDAAEFEHWVDAQRDDLARAYAGALEQLAAEAAARGDAGACAEAWRRRAAHDPYDGRVALALMRALVAAGEREAAILHADAHATRLRDDLGAAPAAEVTGYADELRAAPPALATTRLPLAATREPLATRVPVATTTAASPTPAGSRRFARGVVAALIGAVLLTSALTTLGRREAAPAASDVSTVAVLPFTVRAAPEYAYLAEGLASLLGTSLNGAGGLRSIDLEVVLGRAAAALVDGAVSDDEAARIASALGARRWIVGSLVETGGAFRISATLHDGADVATEATVEGRETDIPALVDELTRLLLAGDLTAGDERLARVASTTTSSLPALKAYLDGERDFRAARYRRAAESFARAVADDPTFALAHYRLSAASAWSFDFQAAHRAAAEALRHAERLPAHDQQLIAAWHAFVEGDADRAERLYEALLTSNPNDVEAWAGLGEVRVHYNAVRGRPVEEARAAFERVLAVAPDYGEARFHMLEFAAARGDRAAFDSILAGVDPANEQAPAWNAVRAIAWGSDAERTRALDRLRGEDGVLVGIAAARLAANVRDYDASAQVATLLTDASRTADWQAAGHILLAQLAAASGHFDEADAHLDAALPLERDWTHETRGLIALHPALASDTARAARAYREILAWDPGAAAPRMSFFFATHADVHAQLRHYLLAMLALRLGDEESALRHRRELERSGRSEHTRQVAGALALSVDAHARARAGDLDGALEALDRARLNAPLERIALSSFFSQALDRALRAQMHDRLGHEAEAARWWRSLEEGSDIGLAHSD